MSERDPVKRIFGEALDLAPDARAAFLDQACAGDAALRVKVEALLTVFDRASGFMVGNTLDTAGHAVGSSLGVPLGERPGDTIGPYKLLQVIGEGGFGTVYMAEQERPLRRRVALKVIKLGMDTRAVIARFEAERQALAMMDHPNIARVLDAGATDSGRPFFVMELVKGEPITTYCDRNTLTIEERLDLFNQLCRAVQHAHTKGLIHRDLKPSNVLVSTQDDKPHAKVIDFGIAKATSARLTDKTLFTEFRQFIGTPEYMSPEQAEGSLDIDTRTDVYSLGVLLYELLTGATPFDPKRLRSAAYDEIRRIIREDEPQKPSTRLSHSEGTLPSVAAHRRTPPARLGTIIRGDLDWIVMKCLEKDRARRYETADGLASDIERHLSGQAVLAAPPAAAYRLRKFIHRHRFGVAAGSILVIALVIGAAGTTLGMLRALRAEHTQAALTRTAENALASEAEQKRLALAAADRARTIAEFMQDMLTGVGPSVALGRDTAMLRDLMDAAAARIDAGELAPAPDAELDLRLTIGSVYRQLALYDQAERMLAPTIAAARPDGPRLPEALDQTARLRLERGDGARALELFQEALDILRARSPGDNAKVADAQAECAECLRELGRPAEALPLYQDALATRERLGAADGPEGAAMLNNLGSTLQELGRAEEALPIYEKARAAYERLYPGDHPDTVSSINNLAACLSELGHADQALPLFQEVLTIRRRLYASDHPQVARALNSLAGCLASLARPDEALPLFEEALASWDRLHPGDHPDIALALNNTGSCYEDLGRYQDALDKYEASLAMYRRIFKGDHPQVANQLNNAGSALSRLGRTEEALDHFQESLAMYQRLIPGDHPSVSNGLNNVAYGLAALGRPEEALPNYQAALEMERRLHDGDHPAIAADLTNLATCLTMLHRPAEALPLLRSGAEMRQRLHSDGHPEVAATLHALADCLFELKRTDEAIETERQAIEALRPFAGPDSLQAANLSRYRGRLGRFLVIAGGRDRAAEAETVLRECLATQATVFPDSHPLAVVRYISTAYLGAAILIQAMPPDSPPDPVRLHEAEPLLTTSADFLLSHQDSEAVTTQAAEAVSRLITLYEALARVEPGAEHGASAQIWRDRLPARADAPPAR